VVKARSADEARAAWRANIPKEGDGISTASTASTADEQVKVIIVINIDEEGTSIYKGRYGGGIGREAKLDGAERVRWCERVGW